MDVEFWRWIPSLQTRGLVWRRRYKMTGPTDDFGHRMGEVVESHTKQFIASWLKANEP